MASSILITGATGFIGRHLTRDLVSAGHAVRVLARSPQKARSLFADSVEISPGDIGDPASLKKACRGIEFVYHVAGIYRFGLRHGREMASANIEGTENVLRAAAEQRVGKIVHVSSASVLARSRSSGPVLTETDFPACAPYFSPYRFSKWEAERRVLAWAAKGLPVVIANPSCPIGSEDETPTPTGQIIRDFIRGRFPCYCHTKLNFVNVSDVSAGLQRMAHVGRKGERYLLTNENLWLKEFLDCLSDKTGLPAPRVRLPHFSILALSSFGELFDLVNPQSTTARICIETALKARDAQFFSHAKAREELGWLPASIQTGIQEALDWYQEELLAPTLDSALPVAKSHAR